MKQGSKIAGGNPERGRVDNDYYATHPDSTKALLLPPQSLPIGFYLSNLVKKKSK